jgi:hypothetical protein
MRPMCRSTPRRRATSGALILIGLMLVSSVIGCSKRPNTPADAKPADTAATAKHVPAARPQDPALTDKQAALNFIREMEHNREYRLTGSVRDIIKGREDAVPLAAIQRGCLVLLKD